MRALNRQGVTVVLTTHYLEEAETMCDQIAIMDQGQIVALGDTKALIQKLDEKKLTVSTIEPIGALPATLRSIGAVLVDDHRIEISYRPSETRVGDLLDLLRSADLTIRDLATVEADLEELFMRLTGSSKEQDGAAVE
jgi:ABC-2 type transport system ATP-binding protein